MSKTLSGFTLFRKYFASVFFPSTAAFLIYADYSHTAAWKKQKAIIAQARENQ